MYIGWTVRVQGHVVPQELHGHDKGLEVFGGVIMHVSLSLMPQNGHHSKQYRVQPIEQRAQVIRWARHEWPLA